MKMVVELTVELPTDDQDALAGKVVDIVNEALSDAGEEGITIGRWALHSLDRPRWAVVTGLAWAWKLIGPFHDSARASEICAEFDEAQDEDSGYFAAIVELHEDEG